MKIIYFGTDVFYECFKFLVESEHEIISLYTYHNEDEYIREEKIAALATEKNIPIVYDKLTEAQALSLFAEKKCDLFFSAEYDSKIPTPNIENFRGINIHNSLLPEGKGYFPIEMRLYKGYDYGGVTIHKLTAQFDKGDILLQHKFDITLAENDRDIYKKCHSSAAMMTAKLMNDFEHHWHNAQKQNSVGSYWAKPSLNELTITNDLTVQEAKHIYRSFGRLCFAKVEGILYKVEAIAEVDDNCCKESFIMNLRDGQVKVLVQE